jgi:hypothetical protein
METLLREPSSHQPAIRTGIDPLSAVTEAVRRREGRDSEEFGCGASRRRDGPINLAVQCTNSPEGGKEAKPGPFQHDNARLLLTDFNDLI